MTSNNAVASSPYALPPKKRRNKLLWIGIPVVIACIVVGAVVGGVIGSRHSSSTSSDSSSSSSSGSSSSDGAVTNSNGDGVGGTATGANGQAYLAISTDSYYMPQYPTGTATSGYSAPSFTSSPKASGAWPADPSPPSTASPRAHPRLIAPEYKWAALPTLIPNDPYLKSWNATIFGNATATYNDTPEAYVIDGGLSGSGVLDPARRIKMKVKNWAYAYRMSNNTMWAERVWTELQNAAGNGTTAFGADNSTRWNPQHFLDIAEFTNAFAIGYDWLYDYWSPTQLTALREAIIEYGLNWGVSALSYDTAAQDGGYAWWTGNPTEINGNWNCVCNGGLTLGALAIMDEDTTNTSSTILSLAPANALKNCMLGVHPDGTWSETANYWYFGTTGAAEMISSLNTTYGTDLNLLEDNSQWNLTSLFHMYVQGMTSLFNYGDHGPNKYSTTANSLMLWAEWFQQPRYMLYQRDQYDSSEPWSMFWYNPAVVGSWWDGLALDYHFDYWNNDWVSSRTSWTDTNGLYFAMKTGYLQGHQTHGDSDTGDFVIDALGQRWAGELGSGQYLATNYFSNETEQSERWYYYRKRTEGQNTLVVDYENQIVTGNVTDINYGTTGEAQGAAPGWSLSDTSQSTAYYTADLTPVYNGTSIQRGIRFINSRAQILLQDDVSNATEAIQWRMHSNASMAFNSAATTATLTLGGETLTATIIEGPSGAAFTQLAAVRYDTDPILPTLYETDTDTSVNGGDLDADQPNYELPIYNTTVLAITIPASDTASTFSLQVLFSPQYSNSTGTTPTLVTNPPNVAISSWTTTSHNN